jgi:hypothetical protein
MGAEAERAAVGARAGVMREDAQFTERAPAVLRPYQNSFGDLSAGLYFGGVFWPVCPEFGVVDF